MKELNEILIYSCGNYESLLTLSFLGLISSDSSYCNFPENSLQWLLRDLKELKNLFKKIRGKIIYSENSNESLLKIGWDKLFGKIFFI